ncbi:tigger transposable element-derived protein 1-like [Homarus americanus]|uniref:tigger transposable element-derived protein 1-like n=1 Tax=Homarus americanus TaxID=6706 RepID=UPI001C441DDF|nr:tigger transposable element-derived protein 1-like [Homarus americanus]
MPKHKPTFASGPPAKIQRSVMTLEEKVAVLDLIKGRMSVAAVARRYGRNESSMRSIKIREKEICETMSKSASFIAKVTSQARDVTLVKNHWRIGIGGRGSCMGVPRRILENGYLPEQVFNADKTGLFWKKMSTRTYISKSEEQDPSFKVAKDCITVLLCGNAAGHMMRPGMIYRSANPRALKEKNKNLLPVYWQSNKKACVTGMLFLEWFHKCFILEVKSYLEKLGLPFKVLLVVDNAPGHPDGI